MGDVFDSLFSILPIALGILWLIGRSNSRRKKAKQSMPPSQRAARKEEVSRRNTAPGHGREQAPSKGLKKALEKFAELSETIQGETAARPPGEEALYEKIESHRVAAKPAKGPAKAQEQGRRVVSRTETEDDREAASSSGSGQRNKSNSWERISALPPLAQGIAWGIILDEPVGSKEPRP